MRRTLAVFLSLVITLCCLPFPALAAEPAGPLGEDAVPTLLDTGRGYVVYYWYNSAVYYSPDGTDWTDLSDRVWVKDAAPYTYLGVGHLGHREFDLCWTGTEYMLRRSLLDDPRATHQRLGDSPQNSVVAFLDEDFQVIGELAFDGPVTAIRYQDGTYYATVAGTETAFTREDWAEEDTGFADVAPTDWFAPYVAACVEDGLMRGTGEGYFSPERTLTARECSVLALRLYDIMQGGTGDFEPAPEDFGQISITLEDGTTLSGGMGDGCIVQGLPLADKAWTWEYVDTRFVYHKYLALDISTPEEFAWLEQVDAHRVMHRAVASYGGLEYPGVMRFFSHDGMHGAFYFSPDDYDAFTEATKVDRVFSTDSGAWYRHAWYYAYTHHTEDDTDANYYLMEDLVQDNNATRWDFASRLARVAGKLPTINDIQTIPVESSQQETLLPLYNAGILTGIDQYGTFYPEGTLTRAEAAAMLARVLRPELRTFFAPLSYREGLPVPAELYGRAYRLTYVGEIPQENTTTEEAEEYRAHLGDDLLADGTYLAFSYSLDDPAYDGPTRYYFYAEKGNGWVDPETGKEFSFPEGETPMHYTHFKNGYLNGYNRYYDLDLKPVTQYFEFVRDIDLNGQGYVNWKGGLYRIEFQ